MSDETNNSLYMALVRGRYNKSAYFRRKRKHQGKGWKPDRLFNEDEQISERGIFCPPCNAIHPYNGPRNEKLGMDYEKRDGKIAVFWICPNTGNNLGELGGTRGTPDH